MPLEGRELGRYRLIRLIRSNGKGEVYLAEDLRIIRRQVAIKVMRSDTTSSSDTDEAQATALAFQHEMRCIARLDHPHIIPILDFGEEAMDSSRLFYVVMPFYPAGSLAYWLQQRDNISLPSLQDVEYIIGQAANALQYAHDHALLHGDVKPSNFLVRVDNSTPNRPHLFLADFGIARFTNATVNASKTIADTLTYMAPEQLRSKLVPASDQYSLAVMIYELLIGRPPFTGTQNQIMFHHTMIYPQPPSTMNPQVPSALDDVLLRALAKHPEARYPNIHAFAQAFAQSIMSSQASADKIRCPRMSSQKHASF